MSKRQVEECARDARLLAERLLSLLSIQHERPISEALEEAHSFADACAESLEEVVRKVIG